MMMDKRIEILIAEDDEGHASLIKKNLRRSGITNQILHFKDGQEALDFLFEVGEGPHCKPGKAYLLLLDIRMPRVSGVEVLEKIKADPELCKIPVIMLTTSDNPEEIERCHLLGCSNYVTKPVEYEEFVKAVKYLGVFLTIVQVPAIRKSGGRSS
jgi:CheY-like chemotaxis protein